MGVRISVSHSAGTFSSINAFNFSVTVIQSEQSKGIWFRHIYTKFHQYISTGSREIVENVGVRISISRTILEL